MSLVIHEINDKIRVARYIKHLREEGVIVWNRNGDTRIIPHAIVAGAVDYFDTMWKAYRAGITEAFPAVDIRWSDDWPKTMINVVFPIPNSKPT